MIVNGIKFDWDEDKNHANFKKHGITFEDATEIFLDPYYVSVQDRIENGEERWQTFGIVDGSVLIMMAHT